MKKYLFYLLGAAALLGGCTQETFDDTGTTSKGVSVSQLDARYKPGIVYVKVQEGLQDEIRKISPKGNITLNSVPSQMATALNSIGTKKIRRLFPADPRFEQRKQREGVDRWYIVEFDEKPEHTKSNLASVGIYIFDWKLLRKMLLADMKDPDSHHDFGKDIIPDLLADGKTLVAYKYKGYWKDVGTIDSLWEANMDLLDSNNELDLNDPTWKIYTEDTPALPQYIGPDAKINKAFITQGCIVEGEVTNSVLFTGSTVGEGAKIIDSVLMPGVEVEAGAVVQRALVADGVKIGKDAVVGSADSEHIELVSKRVKGVE